MSHWDEVVAAATLGTAQRGIDLGPAARDIGLPAEEFAGSEAPAEQVLALSALYASAHRATAGAVPAGELAAVQETASGAVPPGPETQQVPSPSLVATLRQLMGNNRTELVAEGLDNLARAGLRVPINELTTLLDQATRHREIAARVRPVLGQRGLWLCRLNPLWAEALTADPQLPTAFDEQVWAEGTLAERVGVLTALRGCDPEAARELVHQTWGSEDANARVALLETFAERVSPADEEFLSAVLGDRSARVRAVARELLARLPGSAFVARMCDRAGALFSVSDGELRRADFEPDDQARTDGLAEKGLDWWDEVVAAVPIQQWPRLVGARATQLIGPTTATGLRRAATREADAEVAQALLRAGHTDAQLVRLVAAADPAGAAELIARLPLDTLSLLLPELTWDAHICAAVERVLAETNQTPTKQVGDRSQLLRLMQTHLPVDDPRLVQHFCGLLRWLADTPGQAPQVQAAAQSCLMTVNLRVALIPEESR